MHLTKVTLKNYGVYRDKIEFDLSTTDAKPVVLIGGSNGAGKTTLFESLLVGFYGASFLDKKTTKKEYHKFLANKIHRYLGTTAAADSTSIIIDFKFYHNGVVDDYTVDRTWKNEDGRIIEELKIKKDGKRLDSVEESQWQSFIEELIPRGIAKLFFFDGEKIVKMAEEENEDIEIKSSFDSLLGLDVVEQLHSDLRVHIMRNMKDGSKAIQIEHDKHLEEREVILDDIERFERVLGTKNTEMDDLAVRIKEVEANVTKIGGGFASKREELKVKKASLQMKISSLESELKSIIVGSLPLSLIPKQIKSLKSQILKDEEILKQEIRNEIIDERESELSKLLNLDSIFSELIKSQILLNNNISANTSIAIKENKNSQLFNSSLVNLNITNGAINFNKSKFTNNKIGSLEIDNSKLSYTDNDLVLNTDILINIKNSDNLFSLLQTPKNLRSDIKVIKINLDFNFLSNQIDVNRIKFDDIEDNDQALKILKELNDIENFNFHKSRRIFNKVFEAYFG